MSTNSYTNVEQIQKSFSKFVQSAGLTQGDLEWVCEDAEVQIIGYLAGLYPVFTTGNVPPLVRSLTRQLAEVIIERKQITMEDPSLSQHAERKMQGILDIITALQEGRMGLLSGSGTLIESSGRPGDMIWSNTMDRVPTMADIPMVYMRKDPDFEEDEIDRRLD